PLQREVSDDVLGQVRLEARGALRPGDPQAAVREDRPGERVESAGPGPARGGAKRGARAAREVAKNTATSSRPRALVRVSTPSGSSPRARSKPPGASRRPTRCPSLLPSLRGSGVPE